MRVAGPFDQAPVGAVALRRVARLHYGDALAVDVREPGTIPVFASGGRVGWHDEANAKGPLTVVGRKGSYGSVHWVDSDAFVIDTAYAVESRAVVPRWLYYVLSVANLRELSQDVGVPGLSRDSVHDLLIPDLSPVRQAAVVDFLDRECERVEALAGLSARLEERSLEAVMATAEAESDRLPRTRIGHMFEVQLGKMLDEKRIDPHDRRPYLRNANVHWDELRLDDIKTMTFNASERRMLALKPGDLLVCEGGEPGRAAVWNGELRECYYQKALHRLRPTRPASARFLLWSLRVLSRRGAFAADGPGRYTHLTAEMLRNTRVPMPSLEEQLARAAKYDAMGAEARGVAGRAETLRVRLSEYRDALITEAVTGKLDVTKLSDTQLEESAHAAVEGETPEVLAS